MPVFEGSPFGQVGYDTLGNCSREQVKASAAAAIRGLQHRARGALAGWVAWDEEDVGHRTAYIMGEAS